MEKKKINTKRKGKSQIDFIQKIKENKVILGIIGIIIIIVIFYFVMNRNVIPEEVKDSLPDDVKNIKINTLEWRNPKTINPYGGRYYDSCEDGTNIGSVWVDLELQNQEEGVFFSCKSNIIVEDTGKSIESYQLSLIAGESKSSFIGFTAEIAKKHSVEVCCSSKVNEISFCETFELGAYC